MNKRQAFKIASRAGDWHDKGEKPLNWKRSTLYQANSICLRHFGRGLERMWIASRKMSKAFKGIN